MSKKVIPLGSNYVPAIGDNLILQWTKNTRYKDKGFRFFDNGTSFFDHNMLLTSAYYRIQQNDTNHRSIINYPDDTVIIGDSGGFQIMSFGKKGKQVDVTPIQVLRWLESNTDIGMNLDVPPVLDFNKAIKMSVENFRLFESSRENYNFHLYNVLQGRTLSQIDEWYKAVCNFSFDGWAIGVHPSTNIYLKLIAYLYLIENGESNVTQNCHFFGVSGIENMISLSMISRKLGSSITFDSSSWSWGQRFRDYWFSKDVRHCIRLGREFANSMNSIPCDCPICSRITINELYNQQDPMTPLLLSYHDLYQYIETNRMINIMVYDDSTFREYCRSLDCLSVFDLTNKILTDYESGKPVYQLYEKYKDLFKKPIKVDSHKSIFSF